MAAGMIISGAEIALCATTMFADGFRSRIRRSPREYSNSSKLCSVINRRSCSICCTSGLAIDWLFLGFEGCLGFMPVSELDEIPRGAGQYFGFSGVHGYIVLDANAPPHPEHKFLVQS